MYILKSEVTRTNQHTGKIYSAHSEADQVRKKGSAAQNKTTNSRNVTSDLKACRPATVSLCHHERKTEIELKNQIGGKRIIICQFSIGNNILKVLNLTSRNKSSFSMQCPHPQASTAIFHRNLMYAFFLHLLQDVENKDNLCSSNI